MRNFQEDVEQFMYIGEQPTDVGIDSEQAKLYMNLITEEYLETLAAYQSKDLVEVADGLADMVWVIMGMASTLNIPFDAVWEEVRNSNMSKFVDGKAIKDENGKIQKPDTFFRPDIAKALS